jgi:phage repressor protein C with HTH and peptisase S24 domain
LSFALSDTEKANNGPGFIEVWERIKLRTSLKTQADLADMLGIRGATVTGAKQRGFFPLSWAYRIAKHYNINLDWLLFGRESASRVSEAQAPYVPDDVDEYVLVPLLEGRVTAGPDGGIVYEQPDDWSPFKNRWINKKIGHSPEHHQALMLVRVQGDSMAPTIHPGEIVLVDTWEAERINIRDGKIYLVRMPDGAITIKRIILRHKERPAILCLSDNTAYEPFEFEVNPQRGLKYYILGRIRWISQEVD